jgi:hypothetical protein
LEARGSLSEAGEAVAEVGEEDQEVSTAQDGQQQGKQVPHAPTVQTILKRSYLLSSLQYQHWLFKTRGRMLF